MKKKNKTLNIFLIIMSITILYFYISEYQKKEQLIYELYGDYTRGATVGAVSFYKSLEQQMNVIKVTESSQKGQKTTENDLILDFVKYDYIPILNYIKSNNIDADFINDFASFWDFIADHRLAVSESWEDIFIKNESGKYFVLENDTYVYTVEKGVIGKNEFTKLYGDYLRSMAVANVSENFILKLLEENIIKKAYTFETLKEEIKNNYGNFYQDYEKVILKVIGNDLKQFGSYLKARFISYDPDGGVKKGLKENLSTENIRLNLKFQRFARIYSELKYYKYSYDLDLKDLWNQTATLNYPKLYM